MVAPPPGRGGRRPGRPVFRLRARRPDQFSEIRLVDRLGLNVSRTAEVIDALGLLGRITISGHTRRLDELTADLLADHLRQRHERWPHTLNTHLFVSDQTGHGHRPVSEYWIRSQLQGITASLNQIRMDRQLEEALVHGPDALHPAAVFGISERAAIRYADAARALLTSPLEHPPGHPP